MKIYGVAILAACFLLGKILGNLLGALMDINGDVGGVGFAMILLIVTNYFLAKQGWLKEETESGILFWTSMFIPIIIAMAATQNVRAALTGGWVTVVVGGIATMACFFLVPLVAKIGKQPVATKIKVS